MADDLDFESFDNLDDLDWSEIEKDVKESAQQEQPQAQPSAPESAASPGPAAGEAARPTGSHVDIDYLMDVNLQVTVEVGRKHYFINDVLKWDHGGIIELEKLVGEPLNLLVNNKPVAKGEVVVINDKFALKITEILDPNDRINYLQA